MGWRRCPTCGKRGQFFIKKSESYEPKINRGWSCPKCKKPFFEPTNTCPNCQLDFKGDLTQYV